MPLEQFRGAGASREVLSRVASLTGIPALGTRLTGTARVRDLCRRLRQSPSGFRLEGLLAEMQIELRVDSADIARIPSHGSVVAVANHPFGMLDGAILTVLLTRVRPDVKVLSNVLLADVPELQTHCIFVDSFDSDRSGESNRRAMREASAWLQSGGMLAIFPAREISHLQFPQAQVVDPPWHDTAMRLARRLGSSALPIYLCGHNSVHFQLLGMIHPRLRSAFLLQEFLQQEGRTIEVRVGSEIPPEFLAGLESDRKATEYSRERTYLLAQRKKERSSWPAVVRSRLSSRMQQPLAGALAPEGLSEELRRLPDDRLLADSGEFAVYLVQGGEGPRLIEELGRLRELTFRRAGEGTGKRRDLDRFDRYYWHLLLWHKEKCELIGAYRAGNTADILPVYGIRGLYTSTLFRYDPALFDRLGPALELGRSFVRPEYQRQYAPLMLLWKGIARLIAMHPETPVLFGAVSISNDYNQVSREIIYRFFEARMRDDELAGFIVPRHPFRPGRLRRWDCRAMCQALHDLDELSQPITDVEPDGKGLPILLRQYAKIGGKLLGFNVDRKFSNVLDGLVVVDLRQTEPAVLERYMGKEAAGCFRRMHSPQA